MAILIRLFSLSLLIAIFGYPDDISTSFTTQDACREPSTVDWIKTWLVYSVVALNIIHLICRSADVRWR